MPWEGVIIEESLENKNFLDLVNIIRSEKRALEGEQEKGTMQFHYFELCDDKKDEFINRAKVSVKYAWYIHICKNETMVVIFHNKIFEFNKNDEKKLKQARNYGLSIGIIREQMPFEKMIENPYH